MDNTKLNPVHPSEILLEEFLQPFNLTEERLAEDINISVSTINNIIQQKQPITPEIALRLSKYLGLSERFWLNLQVHYDLEIAKDALKNCLDTEVKTLLID
ncbi:MAG: HigA family addiction module antitoxin [Chroococcales cyanobacterium]